MKAPWANSLLLFILLLQIITGYLGMLNNQELHRWVLWLHGIGAYAILLLLFWKGDIILNALRRKRVWTWHRTLFLLTTFFLLLTLLLGLTWTLNGPAYFLNISYVSWHIYVAVPLIVLMLWHSWQMRFVFRLPQALDRRLFLRGILLQLTGILLWQLSNHTKSFLELPGTLRRFTGSYQHKIAEGNFPVVSWIADNPPPIEITHWKLALAGAVKNPLTFSYNQLRDMATDVQLATLDCTGGWYTTQEWQGVCLARLLEEAGLLDGAKSVTIRAISGYQRRFTLNEAERYLLALDVAGETLSHGHGFPLRLVAGNKRGVEWVKWITHVQVNSSGKHWQSPLPLR